VTEPLAIVASVETARWNREVQAINACMNVLAHVYPGYGCLSREEAARVTRYLADRFALPVPTPPTPEVRES
jgi:hypothetical protein